MATLEESIVPAPQPGQQNVGLPRPKVKAYGTFTAPEGYTKDPVTGKWIPPEVKEGE